MLATMAFSAGLLFRVLALGTLVAQVNGLKFNFTDVRQCESFMIYFIGANLTGSGVPATLNVIPVNSSAIPIRVDPEYVSTGISINLLPLSSGSNFIASLDDISGNNLIDTSDLIRVLPPSGISDTNCNAEIQRTSPRRFSLATNVSQCEEMSIMYDTSVVTKAPTVRLFSPKGPSSLLKMTADNPETGTAKYLMNFGRGKEIILLMEDGNTIRETSPLITVAGDASSDSSCLKSMIKGNNTSNMDMTTINPEVNGSSTPSRAIIIGSATGGAAVVLVALSMLIFVIRDRRRRRKLPSYLSNPSELEKQPNFDEKRAAGNPVSPKSPATPANVRGTVFNPVYATNSAFLSPTKLSHQHQSSLASWAQDIPDDQRSRISSLKPPSAVMRSPRSVERLSLESLDIEGMLNMATLQTESMPSRKNSEVTIFGHVVPLHTATLTVPTPTRVKAKISERHLRNPSDVPAGPDSIAFSGYSVNPFDGHTSITPSILRDNLVVITKPSGSVLELPISPRDARSSDGRITSGLVSNRSSSDWYGIAR